MVKTNHSTATLVTHTDEHKVAFLSTHYGESTGRVMDIGAGLRNRGSFHLPIN